jgi:hypothetical protein
MKAGGGKILTSMPALAGADARHDATTRPVNIVTRVRFMGTSVWKARTSRRGNRDHPKVADRGKEKET